MLTHDELETLSETHLKDAIDKSITWPIWEEVMSKDYDSTMVERVRLEGKPVICHECLWGGVDGETTLNSKLGYYVCPCCGSSDVQYVMRNK